MADLEAIAKKLADTVQSQVKLALAEEWDSVSDETKDDIKRTGLRLGELALREFAGEDVSLQKALVLSSVTDWKTGAKFKTALLAEKAESAFLAGLEVAGDVLGKFLGSFAKGSIAGLLKV